MWKWLKPQREPDSPTVKQKTLGALAIPSGVLLLADPYAIYDPVRIEGVPPGQFPVQGQIIRYPEGGRRIAKIGLVFRPGTPESRQTLGTIGVDSATVVAVDAAVHEQYWQEVGPERIGHVGVPQHRKIARLIEKEFGLKSRPLPRWGSEFEEPISEDLEAKIKAYLAGIPEYAESTCIYFWIKTMNTCDRLMEAMQDRIHAEVLMDGFSGASLLALSSGFGDGSYPVEGLYGSGELLGVEVEFIGPAQDKVLEAFPILRY